MKNRILKMDELPADVQVKVANCDDGTFKNTFVLSDDTLYIFTREGQCHFTEPDMKFAKEIAEFEWYVDAKGCAATDDLKHIRSGIRLHSLVYIYFCTPRVWYVDRKGVEHTDWSMAEFII